MAFLEELIFANAWAQKLESPLQALRPSDLAALAAAAAPDNVRGFAEARRAFHEALSADGTEAWNQWTERMLTLRPRALGQASEAAMLWRALAFVDLSNSQFTRDLDWAERSFPSSLCLSQTRIAGYAYLTSLRVRGDVVMDGVSFERDCWMDQWVIEGSASFRFASWAGRLEGRASRFAGGLNARDATFGRDCWFVGSTIGGLADFTDAQFHADAGFGDCRFARDAVFEAASFDDTVGMEGCVFAGPLSLRKASFAKRLFLNRASFAEEPVIDRAEFALAPSLTDARFPAASSQSVPSPLRSVSSRR